MFVILLLIVSFVLWTVMVIKSEEQNKDSWVAPLRYFVYLVCLLAFKFTVLLGCGAIYYLTSIPILKM